MKLKLELLKVAVKRKLMQLCGVEQLVKNAFIEGYSTALDTSHSRVVNNYCGQFVGIANKDDVDRVMFKTRRWSSVDEAWCNSDAQEFFE